MLEINSADDNSSKYNENHNYEIKNSVLEGCVLLEDVPSFNPRTKGVILSFL